jgi:hypothetical protein
MFGKISGIFKVDDLNLFNRSISSTVLASDHDIVWLDNRCISWNLQEPNSSGNEEYLD